MYYSNARSEGGKEGAMHVVRNRERESSLIQSCISNEL